MASIISSNMGWFTFVCINCIREELQYSEWTLKTRSNGVEWMNDVQMERMSCSPPWRTCHLREAELWIWSILLVYKLKNWYRYPFLDNTSQVKCLSVFDKCAVNKWAFIESNMHFRQEYIGNRAQETEMVRYLYYSPFNLV